MSSENIAMSGLIYSRNGTVYSRDNPPLPRKDFNFTEAQKSEYKDKLYTLPYYAEDATNRICSASPCYECLVNTLHLRKKMNDEDNDCKDLLAYYLFAIEH